MSDIALDLDPTSPTYNDIKIVDNDLVLVDGTTAILQDILQRLRFYYGEWFLDITLGIDYFNRILVKNPDLGKINAIMINAIVTTPGVTGLNKYQLQTDFLTRQVFIEFRAQTTQGTVDYAGLLNS